MEQFIKILAGFPEFTIQQSGFKFDEIALQSIVRHDTNYFITKGIAETAQPVKTRI